MKKRYLIVAFAFMFLAMNLGLSNDVLAEKRYGIEWEPLYERIDAHEYKLPEGWQEADITIAAVLKEQGYATGQFGKNHFGDRDEHLPTNHGFDEFLGNLYHLNAEEEPENRDYPRDFVMPDGRTFLEHYGPRGVMKSIANPDGTQTIENTGPLTKKRMETIDDETVAAAKDFSQRQH